MKELLMKNVFLKKKAHSINTNAPYLIARKGYNGAACMIACFFVSFFTAC